YYVGTIDTKTSSGGDHPVLSAWYGNDNPRRDETGWAYARDAGTVVRPLDGLSLRLGGKAPRTTVGASGSQWANVVNLTPINRTVAAGQPLRTRMLIEDRDSSARVRLYVDNNRNPYDGASDITSKAFAAGTLQSGRIDMPTAGVKPGTYYLAAAITDASGHKRWTYSPARIRVTPPAFAAVANGTLTINATDGNDRIRLYQTRTQYVATLNGATQNIDVGGVTRIEVYAGAGNDTFDGSGTAQRIYVNGGAGRDLIVGGDGDDTLTGGAQSNTLIGGLGDDALNGSGGNDSMIGNGGNDRFYGNGGTDTMNGGSNVDRFYGGDDADYIIGGSANDKIYAGGGNDTLIGGLGADILAGGAGTDTADNDPLDLRSDIEVLT
ncbi:MAG TPA: hypothetical protein VGB55_10155, partial [Tepidisphaeraceae bacterium]